MYITICIHNLQYKPIAKSPGRTDSLAVAGSRSRRRKTSTSNPTRWRAWTRKIVHLGKRKFRNDTHEDLRPSGGVRTGCQRTIDVMEMSIFNNRRGVVLRRQVWTVPGHYDPSQYTGSFDSRKDAGMGQSRATSFNLRMLHWNAEGVRNKKTRTSSSSDIDVCCI